jgi:hypothetical protein
MDEPGTGAREVSRAAALDEAFEKAIASARGLLAAGDARAAFAQLERAHVLGQTRFGPHLRVHLGMLRAGWQLRDGPEVLGQLMRLALVPVGHLTGRLPIGNTGGANVSAFTPMPIAPELQRLIDEGRP